MDKSFNARFGAVSKTYVYRIFTGQVQSPFSQRFALHMPFPARYARPCAEPPGILSAQKDFSSFTSDEPGKKRMREVDEFKMQVKKEEIIFTVRGKSFLRYMVRNMVGTLIDVGRGKIDADDIPDIFAAKDRRRAGQTAPAKGLTLVKVEYGPVTSRGRKRR